MQLRVLLEPLFRRALLDQSMEPACEGHGSTGWGKKNQIAKPGKGTSLPVQLAAENTSAL